MLIPTTILYHTFETTFFDPIMWGMTVGAVGLPPGYIIAQIYTQISFVARKVNDIKVYIVEFGYSLQ